MLMHVLVHYPAHSFLHETPRLVVAYDPHHVIFYAFNVILLAMELDG